MIFRGTSLTNSRGSYTGVFEQTIFVYSISTFLCSCFKKAIVRSVGANMGGRRADEFVVSESGRGVLGRVGADSNKCS